MGAGLAFGLLVSLASACVINLGFFVQHRAAADLPPLRVRHPISTLVPLLKDRAWVIGNLAGVLGWLLYLLALWLAPLSLVQAASAGGVGVLALAVWKRGGVTLSQRELAGVGVAMVGLVLLGVSLAGRNDAGSATSLHPLLAWLGLSVVAALIAMGPLARTVAPGAGFGIASGILYAAGDVANKAAYGGRYWLWPVLCAFHLVALIGLQLGFQRGGALATAGSANLLLNALPIVAGVTLYHEAIPAGPLGAIRVAAFGLVIAGAVLLARGEPRAEPSLSQPEAIA
jgi:hypothetical protein